MVGASYCISMRRRHASGSSARGIFCFGAVVPLAACTTATLETSAPHSEPARLAPAVAPVDDERIEPESAAAVELEPEDISLVVLGRYESIGGCHTVQYSGSSEAEGALTLAWKIRPDGSVADANVVDSSFGSSAFHDCVLSIVRDMHFPSSETSTEVGAWKISFAGREQHSRR